jgi:protein-tyrosine phosphatase
MRVRAHRFAGPTALRAPHTALFTNRRPAMARASTDAAPALDPLSATYSATMNAAMGSSLTYDHARGINWTLFDGAQHVHPRIIVGSCPQSPTDIATLARAGVGAILCLQQGADWDHFGIDGVALRAAARDEGVAHYIVPVEDFSPSSLRACLADAVAVLDAALASTAAANTRVYVHCTAGLGRAPATALAHAAWVRGAPLGEAAAELRAARPCNPRLAAVRNAAADMVLGTAAVPVTLEIRRNRQGGARDAVWSVAGLDAGWDARLPLVLDPATGRRLLTRSLPPGRHEFKLVVTDPETGEDRWVAWPDWPTLDAGSGNVNNYVDVLYSAAPPTPASVAAERRLTAGDPSVDELAVIRRQLRERKRRAVARAADPATRGVAGAARWLAARLLFPPR